MREVHRTAVRWQGTLAQLAEQHKRKTAVRIRHVPRQTGKNLSD